MFVWGETLSVHVNQDLLGYAVSSYMAKKIDLYTARAVCRRMLNIAKLQNIEIVINNREKDIQNYTPSVKSCNTESAEQAFFIAMQAAAKLNINARVYDKNTMCKITSAHMHIKNFFIRDKDYDVVDEPDIFCSASDNHCVVNQKITYENSNEDWYYVFCLMVNPRADSDGSCIIDDEYIGRPYMAVFYRPKSLKDFDKKCNPLFTVK